ncbi:ABC transporter substrate-binding protein [Saccharopolyspora shandongensis]|uniref:ABC transporter substrate-binding protein n=1 Tax=Saccharopolyspora shandongensis TaxID=418495 RepID=UPI0033D64492
MRHWIVSLFTTLVLLGASACGLGSNPLSAGEGGGDPNTIVVGSANFQESQLLATIYAQALRDRGLNVQERFNIASREAYVPGLTDGSIDLIPEYSGALLQHLKPETSAQTREEVLAELKTAVPKGTVALNASSAENKDVLTVSRETAERYNLKTISDLKPHAANLTLGGPPEWKTRQNGVVGLEKVYGLHFKSFAPLDAGGPLTVSALTNGQIDVADLFSTDPAISDHDLVTLQDDQELFLPENILPLANSSKVTPRVAETLNAISAQLTTDQIRSMIRRVVTERENPKTVAREWLHHAALPA